MSDYWKEVNQTPSTTRTDSDLEILRPSNEALVKKVHSASGWPYAIAALTALNLFLGFFDTPVRFTLGIQVADVVYAIGQAISPVFGYIGMFVGVLIAAAVAGLGILAAKMKLWPLYVLIAVVVLDLALFGVMQWLMSQAGPAETPDTGMVPVGSSLVVVLIHVWALLALIAGVGAARTYQRRKEEGKV